MRTESSKMKISSLILLVCHSSVVVLGSDLNYTIEEELAINTPLAKITDDVDFTQYIAEDQVKDLSFKILTEGNDHSDYFGIHSETSQLYIKDRIDRDTLTHCELKPICVLDIQVAANGPGYFNTINVRFYIIDVNDNVPTFDATKTDSVIEFSESAGIGLSKSLVGAIDKDYGNYSVQKYILVPQEYPFNASLERLRDGGTGVNVIVKSKLDRETQDLYQIRIIAEDGGNPSLTGYIDVNVVILDVNDSPPKFTKEVYNFTVNEDVAINTTIGSVNATDADTDANAIITYSLSPRLSDEILSQFSINSSTGEIKVIKQLSYVSGEPLRIIVEASDGVEIEQADVVVNILNSRNKAPQINVNILQGNKSAVVSEYANVGFAIAHIAVIDRDSGRNGNVSCHMDSNSNDQKFRIDKLEGKQYKVTVADTLDRESTSGYDVNITCVDKGIPPLNSSVSFKVNVTDENDNPPRFTQGTYYVNYPENNDVGDVVARVSATDLDADKNAKVSYTIVSTGGYQFWINEDSGEIRANFVMDRETTDGGKFTIKVAAEDGGSPSLLSSATVILGILDVNDNQPKFNQSEYQFAIIEDAPVESTVGQLAADDGDLGENGSVTFSFKFQPSSDFPFILNTDGSLLLIKALDRELKDRYDFMVSVSDNAQTPLTSSVPVSVIVLDQNDNDPHFVFPNNVNNSATVSFYSEPGTLLTTARAVDIDANQNGQITYSIVPENMSDIIAIEAGTGQIRLVRKFSSQDSMTFSFNVVAKDGGNEPRAVSRRLTIYLTKELPPSDDDSQNFLIAVVVGCITVVLSITIVLIIVIVRRRDKKESGGNARETQLFEPPNAADRQIYLIENKENLKKVSLPPDFETTKSVENSKDGSKVNLSPKTVYKLSEKPPNPFGSPSPRSLSPSTDPHVRSDPHAMDPSAALQLHRALLQSHDQHRQNGGTSTPPLTRDNLKLHEEICSESSGDTIDSGRGGSLTDMNALPTYQQIQKLDPIKRVQFSDTKSVPRPVRSNSENLRHFHRKHVPNSISFHRNPIPLTKTSPNGDISYPSLTTSHDDDDNTTTSGSYTIDDDWNSDLHNQSRTYILSQNEAYC